MGRGKVVLKRIENPTNRQVTFSKRRNGLLKKAFELSILCDVEIATLIFSPSGKLYQFASHDMDKTIARYRDEVGLPLSAVSTQSSRITQSWRIEIEDLKRSIDALEVKNKHLAGENISMLGMKELRQLERQLKAGVERVRAKKRRVAFEQIRMLRNKRKALQEENMHLLKQLDDLQEEKRSRTLPVGSSFLLELDGPWGFDNQSF